MATPSRTIYSIFSLSLVLLLLQAGPVSGQGALSQVGSAEINVTADSLTVGDSGSQVEAKGNVEIKRQDTTLKAEEVRVNRTTQEIEAKGNVSMDDPQWKLRSAETVQFNLEKETGEIQKGDVFLTQDHLSLSGSRLEKLTGQTYHIDEGFFTTCLCESGPPTWKVSADEIDLRREGEAVIRRGWFYIMDYPVLYFPYAIFPARTERQTGFLFPSFGSSTTEGYRYVQPFFWAISKSTDATFGLDVETKARVGLMGELRTIFNRDSPAVQLNASYFNELWRKNRSVVDTTIADPTIPVSRWSVTGTYRYATTSDWLTYSDVAAFSDNLFTRELVDRFGLAPTREVDVQTSRFDRSRFGFFKAWDDTYLRGDWAFYQDFIQFAKTTFQKTPQITAGGQHLFQTIPIELRWQGEAVSYLRRDPGDGFRFDVYPQVVMPFRISNYLFGSVSAAPRETAYHLYTNPNSSVQNISRELVELRWNIGTSIGRIFDWGGESLQRIKHAIEPEISYLFIPFTNQNKIPIMDGVDRINRRNILTFTLNNRLWGRFGQQTLTQAGDQDVELLNPSITGDVRELAQLGMALSFDIDNARKGGDSLSDLDLNLRLAPTSYLSLTTSGGLNPGQWNLTQGTVALSLFDPRPITRRVLDADFMRPNAIGISYNYIAKTPNDLLAENANVNLGPLTSQQFCAANPTTTNCSDVNKAVVGAIYGNLFYRITDHLLFSATASWDVRDARSLSSRGVIKILSQCECWTLTFSLGQTINPAKTSFNFNFNLLGLGSQQTSSIR